MTAIVMSEREVAQAEACRWIKAEGKGRFAIFHQCQSFQPLPVLQRFETAEARLAWIQSRPQMAARYREASDHSIAYFHCPRCPDASKGIHQLLEIQ